MATNPMEPELDLTWLEEMPADENEETGAASQDAAPSNLQLEALLTNQTETCAALVTLQVEIYRQLAMLAAEIATLKGEVKQLAKQTSREWQGLQVDVTSQTVAVQELYARTQNSQSKFDYLLQGILALTEPLAANKASQSIPEQRGSQTSRRQQQSVQVTFTRWGIVLLLLAQSVIVAGVTAFVLFQFSPRASTTLPPQQSAALPLLSVH